MRRNQWNDLAPTNNITIVVKQPKTENNFAINTTGKNEKTVNGLMLAE